ncbi:hypothetical protein BDP55DRAFT_660482 [Colletotrichum godetiae]|uniref:Uncharacterized protein n=1 Tax=Colletotrichum godetiae TaxID=1209918 RepID=A0AAJ0AQF1_9PEZI|nr:uncharacterized protein BDP55DRAFT_660482 [Colletotrichum godetiae]KAK1676693.1 hypothetical protein BDP55DRAFT_660482 [Colletotrichum godetiae]
MVIPIRNGNATEATTARCKVLCLFFTIIICMVGNLLVIRGGTSSHGLAFIFKLFNGFVCVTTPCRAFYLLFLFFDKKHANIGRSRRRGGTMMMFGKGGCGDEAGRQAVDTKEKENNLMSHDAAGPRRKGERKGLGGLERLTAIRQNV